MLRRKLELRGFSSKATALATTRLLEDGFLDDGRFAAAFAASRLFRRRSKAEGPASLGAALRGRGIDRATADEAIAGLLGPEERAAALEAAAQKEMKRANGDRDELKRRLRALGFKYEEIAEYFERDQSGEQDGAL
jgi:SOS response regulatory protein OraA/RecX